MKRTVFTIVQKVAAVAVVVIRVLSVFVRAVGYGADEADGV